MTDVAGCVRSNAASLSRAALAYCQEAGHRAGGALQRAALTVSIGDYCIRDVTYCVRLRDGSIAGEWRQVAAAFDVGLDEEAPCSLQLTEREAGAVLVNRGVWVIRRLLKQ